MNKRIKHKHGIEIRVTCPITNQKVQVLIGDNDFAKGFIDQKEYAEGDFGARTLNIDGSINLIVLPKPSMGFLCHELIHVISFRQGRTGINDEERRAYTMQYLVNEVIRLYPEIRTN